MRARMEFSVFLTALCSSSAPLYLGGQKYFRNLEELVCRLHDIEAVKFGSFVLKSGITSPVYFDLRVIVSFPDLMVEVSRFLWETVSKGHHSFTSVCGVPYTALPMATVISTTHNIPMLIRRKEAKDYGTKKLIEGRYTQGEKCLIVEDVVTSGTSVLETVEALASVGVEVEEAVVLLDRQQGGLQVLAAKGITLRSVCTLTQVVEILQAKERLSEDVVKQVQAFIATNQFSPSPPKVVEAESRGASPKTRVTMTYEERASLCRHPLGKKLLEIMSVKQSNVVVSVDLMKCEDVLQLVDQIGSFVCGVKTHVDILKDFTPQFTQQLRRLADKHGFLLLEDRKFGDIGHTVSLQYGEGLYRIADWADLVTVHSSPGPGVIEGLKEAQSSRQVGAILVAEMSSEGNLTKGDYCEATVKMAEAHRDAVIGLVCQSSLTSDPEFILMIPGVKMSGGSDKLGQRYNSPEDAVKNRGADVIIVGRGITGASDPVAATKAYQAAGFSAYLARIEWLDAVGAEERVVKVSS